MTNGRSLQRHVATGGWCHLLGVVAFLAGASVSMGRIDRPVVYLSAVAVAFVMGVLLLSPRVQAAMASAGEGWFLAWGVTDTLLLAAIIVSRSSHPGEAAWFFPVLLFFAAGLPTRRLRWSFLAVLVTAAGVALRGSGLPVDTQVAAVGGLAATGVVAEYLVWELRNRTDGWQRASELANRRADLLGAVAAASRAMSSTLEPAAVLRSLQLTLRWVGGDVSALVVVEEPEGLRWLGSVGERMELEGELLPTEGIAGAVIRSGETVVIDDYPAYEHALAELVDRGVRAAVGTPVRVRGRVVAVLAVGSKSTISFDASQIEALESLAVHAGIALQNAYAVDHRRSADDVPTAPATGDAALENGAGLWSYVHELVLLTDTVGQITSASPSWSSYGMDPGDVVGRPLLTIVHPEDRVVFEPYLLQPALASTRAVVQARLSRGDGWMPTVATLEAGPGGTIAVTVLPLDDVLARTVDAERRAADQLRVIDEMKHRLVEAISHELRTPLTVITGFAETLQRPDISLRGGDLERIGASMQRHAGRLERIVGDLVDLDRSSSVVLTDFVPADLGELVRSVLGTVDLGDRIVHVELPPVVVPVDAARFRRAVERLLDNVRRHTPPGTNVWVELASTSEGALLSIADDGPGLPEDLAADPFSPFSQAIADRASPGLGLGLAVVERLAELHGGRSWYGPREGGGSRFSLLLPRQAGDGPGPSAGATTATTATTAAPVRATDADPDAAGSSDTIRSILATARRELGMRVAYLSELTPSEQVVVETDGDGGSIGISRGLRLRLDETYCARMVTGELPNIILDARRTPAVASLASTEAGVGCYVGVPVHLPSGHVFGTLCCADDRPRSDLAGHELATLRALAGVIGEELARRQVSVEEQRELTRQIEGIIRRPDGLQIVYQPIVELESGDVAGVEALSRFPDSMLRPPDVWFADAARVGLAGQLEQASVMRALSGLQQLSGEHYLSVNLSPDAMRAGALRPLLGRVPLERIVVEITEHAAVADYDALAALLRPFRAGGARLAIDDVGAGFASLRHVLQLAPEIIKLDRSLVADVAGNPGQRAVAGAFGGLAQRLGASVVAEGVEDVATLHALLDAGITHGQGWFFDRARALPLRTSNYGPWARSLPHGPPSGGGERRSLGLR
ncbi:MAG: EAL domain-containing protein [Actinobacteria bacterium]|nr:EAL domain-containing protein [Actinomycetota bacterium]